MIHVRSGQSVNRTKMKGQRSHLAYSGHHDSVSALCQGRKLDKLWALD